MNKENNEHSKWLEAVALTHRELNKEAHRELLAVGNTRQDMTLPILEEMRSQGYDLVTWDSGNSTHSVCRELHNQQWPLDAFLSGLAHAAPLFERSHPGDVNCKLVVSGPNLPSIVVDSYGNWAQI